jgi:hypothetical protein
MRRARVIGIAAIAVLMLRMQLAGAQAMTGGRAGVAAESGLVKDSIFDFGNRSSPDSARPLRAPFAVAPAARPYAPLASALIPGSGQAILGQDRFVVYAAIEIFSWWTYAKDRHEQAQQEAAFKQIASSVARAHFTANPRDTVWTYYEEMRDWLESGYYSKSATGPIEPETDTLTFNGYHWQLALRTHPTREAALAEYEEVAIRPEFQWSWRNAQFQFDVFRRTTDKRNDANRAAVRDLMIIGANHMLSLVDAFASVRLEILPSAVGGRSGAQIRASVPWGR